MTGAWGRLATGVTPSSDVMYPMIFSPLPLAQSHESLAALIVSPYTAAWPVPNLARPGARDLVLGVFSADRPTKDGENPPKIRQYGRAMVGLLANPNPSGGTIGPPGPDRSFFRILHILYI